MHSTLHFIYHDDVVAFPVSIGLVCSFVISGVELNWCVQYLPAGSASWYNPKPSSLKNKVKIRGLWLPSIADEIVSYVVLLSL